MESFEVRSGPERDRAIWILPTVMPLPRGPSSSNAFSNASPNKSMAVLLNFDRIVFFNGWGVKADVVAMKARIAVSFFIGVSPVMIGLTMNVSVVCEIEIEIRGRTDTNLCFLGKEFVLSLQGSGKP